MERLFKSQIHGHSWPTDATDNNNTATTIRTRQRRQQQPCNNNNKTKKLWAVDWMWETAAAEAARYTPNLAFRHTSWNRRRKDVSRNEPMLGLTSLPLLSRSLILLQLEVTRWPLQRWHLSASWNFHTVRLYWIVYKTKLRWFYP